MNLLTIAWRNMQQRRLATILTIFSIALGVTLVVLVLSISWIMSYSFNRNSNVGYNLIVGAKGSPLQLTLNTVFYLSRPIETLPYDDYLEFLPKADRVAEIKRIGGMIAEPERGGVYGDAYMKGGFAIPVCLGDYYGPFRVVGTKPSSLKSCDTVRLQSFNMNSPKVATSRIARKRMDSLKQSSDRMSPMK